MSFQIDLTVDLRRSEKYVQINNNQTELVKVDNPAQNMFFFFAFSAEVQLIGVESVYTVNGIARTSEVKPMDPTFTLLNQYELDATISDRASDIKSFNLLKKWILKHFTKSKYMVICCLDFSKTKLNRLLTDQFRIYGIESKVGLRNHLQEGSWGCVLHNNGSKVMLMAEKERDATADNFVYFPLSHQHTYVDKTELTRILNQDTTIAEVPTVKDLDVIIFFLYGFALNNLLPLYSLLLGIRDRFNAVINGSEYTSGFSFESDKVALQYFLNVYVDITTISAIPKLHDQSLALLSKTSKLKTAESPAFVKDLTQMLETLIKVVIDINYKIVNPVLNDPEQIARYFALLRRLGYI